MFSRLTTSLSWIGGFIFCVHLINGDNDCGISVDYVGKSGQFKLESDCTSEFLKLKMESLTEVDSSGDTTNNQVSSFANQDYEWQTDEDGTFQGLSAIVNTYSSDLSVGQSSFGEFNFTTILFLENGTITVDDGEEIDVNSRSLKWTIEMNDWPFLSSNNSLEICMNVGHGGSGDSGDSGDSTDSTDSSDTDSTDDDDSSTNSTDSTDSTDSIESTEAASMDSNDTDTSGSTRRLLSTSSQFGDFNLIVPLTAELDGEIVDGVTFESYTSVYNDSSSSDGDDETSMSFCWVFDNFDSSLVYDPVAQYNDESSKPVSTQASSSISSSTNNNEESQEDATHNTNIKQRNCILIASIFSLIAIYFAK